ncbi:hypothetical protein D039_1130B, partial [Vibrio parahaemolyticus EKP-028]
SQHPAPSLGDAWLGIRGALLR